ncbi:protein of unknown function DUF1200 [Clostridium sp. DL-VIII]|uniref:PH domain-containing protein n=1 Tax=Clostridium sp. DL-VIII TaxID=641107 RepID=UPI00023AF682|nr:PH domain-containing protein [Clostridium sp. DL-VIII]EHI97378.1 protein of unknown function DUF1200 [Clostridium sp. DL-VIII]
MKFKSKIDLWFHLVVILFIILTLWLFYSYVTNKISIIMLILFIAVLILIILPMYLFTYYVFEDSCIHIRCGLMVNIKIDYKDIVSLKKSKSLISSPALSMDRIEIKYYRNFQSDFIIISPERKQEFIDELNKKIVK